MSPNNGCLTFGLQPLPADAIKHGHLYGSVSTKIEYLTCLIICQNMHMSEGDLMRRCGVYAMESRDALSTS